VSSKYLVSLSVREVLQTPYTPMANAHSACCCLAHRFIFLAAWQPPYLVRTGETLAPPAGILHSSTRFERARIQTTSHQYRHALARCPVGRPTGPRHPWPTWGLAYQYVYAVHGHLRIRYRDRALHLTEERSNHAEQTLHRCVPWDQSSSSTAHLQKGRHHNSGFP